MAFPTVTLSQVPLPAPAAPPDDPSLIARVRQGDMDALSTIYQIHAGMLTGVAYRLTGSMSDAEDVVQDLFVGLPGALAQYDERGRFPHWLRRLAVRLALMRLRADRRRREWSLDEAREMGDSSASADQVHLYEALRELTPDDRAMVILKVVEGYSHREIAELFGIRRSASEVRLHRALARLRKRMVDTT